MIAFGNRTVFMKGDYVLLRKDRDQKEREKIESCLYMTEQEVLSYKRYL